MRARNIKPSLFKNETLGAADPLFTIVFEGLWCLADRDGRLEDRPLRIHAEVNPYRDSASTVLALDWLVQERFVTRYEVDGVKYLEVANFRKHQQPHVREAASKIPPPKNQEVVEARCEHGAEHVPSTGRARLIPDSGFPLPDSGLRNPERAPDAETPATEVGPVVRACLLLRERGHLVANPSHPGLMAAIAAGLTPEELVAVADEFPGKPLAYWLKAAQGRRQDAARITPLPATAQRWTPPEDDPEYTRASA